jgi:hypothetical protein
MEPQILPAVSGNIDKLALSKSSVGAGLAPPWTVQNMRETMIPNNARRDKTRRGTQSVSMRLAFRAEATGSEGSAFAQSVLEGRSPRRGTQFSTKPDKHG